MNYSKNLLTYYIKKSRMYNTTVISDHGFVITLYKVNMTSLIYVFMTYKKITKFCTIPIEQSNIMGNIFDILLNDKLYLSIILPFEYEILYSYNYFL